MNFMLNMHCIFVKIIHVNVNLSQCILYYIHNAVHCKLKLRVNIKYEYTKVFTYFLFVTFVQDQESRFENTPEFGPAL